MAPASGASQGRCSETFLPLEKILETIVQPSCFLIAQEVHLGKEVNAFPDGLETPET